MELYKDTPVLLFKTSVAWEQWLSENHDKFHAIWIKFAKKNSGVVSITYDEAVEVGLCFGWIDGLLNKFDETFYVVRFTPRKVKSVWSKRNQEIVVRLIAEKKMHKSGLQVIDRAKANGSWHNSYDSSKKMQMPQDFLLELAKYKKAESFFKTLNRANTYAIAWRLQTAGNPQTRNKRMETILTMLKKGEKLH